MSMMSCTKSSFVPCVTICLALAHTAYADYYYTPFGVPGATHTYPQATNDFGLITGYFDAPSSGADASFLYNRHSGQLRAFQAPGSSPGTTRAWGLNNIGDVVGQAVVGGVQKGFIWDTRNNTWEFKNYSENASKKTVIYSINDSGTHFGAAERYLRLAPGASRQWASRPFGVSSDVKAWLPGGSNDPTLRIFTPYDTNNSGSVFGSWYDIGYDAVAFPVTGTMHSQYTEYGYPGTSTTWGYGINDAGYMTGARAHPNPAVGSGGWVRSPVTGAFTSIIVPFTDATSTQSVRDIDASGALVGDWTNSASQRLGFIATTAAAPSGAGTPGGAAGRVLERFSAGVASYEVENTGSVLDAFAVLIATSTLPSEFGPLPAGWSALGVDIVGDAAFTDGAQLFDLTGLGFDGYDHGALFYTDSAPLLPGETLGFSAMVGAGGSPFIFTAAPIDLALDNTAFLTASGNASLVPLPPAVILLLFALPTLLRRRRR